MTRPWKILDEAHVLEGKMILLKRGEGDFLIRMDNYVLMNSKLNLTELALAKLACERLTLKRAPRVLIGGLGMGYTLRAALDSLPTNANVIVAELNPIVAKWCKGPMAELTNSAVDDPRVTLKIVDVAQLIATAAAGTEKYDAIILDLYQGTHEAKTNPGHSVYGYAALRAAKGALFSNGVFAAWTEDPDHHFQQSLGKAGFVVERFKLGKGGPRHVVYLGVKPAKPKSNQ